MKRFIVSILLLSNTCLAQRVTKQQRAVESGLTTFRPAAGQKTWTITERLRAYGVAGVSVAVIDHHRLAWAQGYGWADTTRKRPVTRQTLFSAGSVSKPVAALAILQLVQRGQLSLDSNVNRYLTSWQVAESALTRQRAVTLRQLLSHTAGATQHGFWGIQPQDSLPSLTQILNGEPVAQSRRIEIDLLPGSRWRYSGGGYLIAQQVAMDRTHQPFETYVRQALFEPLGMQHSSFAQPLPAYLSQQAALPYCRQSWFKGQPHVYPQQAAAGLYTNPTDLATVVMAVQRAYQGRSGVIPPAVARTMLQPAARNIFGGSGFSTDRMALDSTDMGIGFFLTQRSDGRSDQYFFHTGQNAGFVSLLMGSLHQGTGVIVMVNDNDATELINEIVRSVARVYRWKNVLPEPLQPVRLPAAQLAQYVGTYKRGEELITLTRQGDHLLQQGANWRMGIAAYPVGQDTIGFTDYVTSGVFKRNASGKVTTCQGVVNGKVLWEMVKLD